MLGTVYISPRDSTVHKADKATDTFEVLHTQIETFSDNDNILLGGDFNACLGTLQDFVKIGKLPNDIMDDKDEDEEDLDDDIGSRGRTNQDKKSNAQGNDLRDLCISTDLCILNGRTIGDMKGQYTYVGHMGCSTVDYALGSKNFRNNLLKSFTVEHLNIFSDHRPITTCLGTNLHNTGEQTDPNILENLQERRSTPKYDEIYLEKLNSDLMLGKLDELQTAIISKMSTNENIYEDLGTLEKLLIESMNPKGQTNPNTTKHRVKKFKGQKQWYNRECKLLKRKLNYLCKRVNEIPQNVELRRNFYHARKQYRSLTKSLKREFEKSNIDRMEGSAINKNTDFWKIFKKIRNPEAEDDFPDPGKIQKFFEDLYTENELQNETCSKKCNGNQGMDQIAPMLSAKITIDEIIEHLKRLKKKKASGIDGVINEMLINANYKVINILQLIFNNIIETEDYPEKWNISLTQLIYKDGDKGDPGNYRGIALGSNLGKLFNAIINSRLYKYMEDQGLLRPEQGGFRKGFRTMDHIFTLITIISKYLTKGKRMYACYVDLKKAYDSVWRKGLTIKLKDLGVDEKTVNIISSMYKNTYTSVIFKRKLLPKIRVTKGLKQGDNLSPLLFNIYINDLPQWLNKGNTYPVDLIGVKLNCLLWADDLVLMSETPEGLQQCVHNLQGYCQKWKLEINMKKTKVMTFNKSGKKLKFVRIFVNETLLKNVTQYTYLGFTISASGTLTHGINNLVDKAKRAWFSIRRILSKSRQKNVRTYITLFDYVVKPILLYACEIWGANIKASNSLKSLGETTWERFHIQVCRNILGVHRGTSKIATLAEIGRYPIEIDVHMHMIRYLLRFGTMHEEKLVVKAL